MSVNLLAALMLSPGMALPPGPVPGGDYVIEQRVKNAYRSANPVTSRLYTQGYNRLSQKARRKRARWRR